MTKNLPLSILLAFMALTKSNAQVGVNAAGAAPTTLSMFEVLQTSGTDNTFGIYVNHSGTPTTGYALQAIKSGAGVNNIAAYLNATGGTNNIALRLAGSTSGSLDISPAAATTSYGITFPAAQGAANSLLLNDGSGGLSWSTLGSLSGAALTKTNDANVTLTLGGSPATSLVNAASLTLGWTGQLSIPRGGTNSGTALAGSSIMISDGTSIIQGAAGTTTTLLHGNAAGAPTFGAASLTTDVAGILPIANGGTNNSTAYTSGSVIFSDGTSLTQNNTKLFWNNTNNNLGIGTATPDASASLDISGTSKGILIPRVTLTGSGDATTITPANVISMLVYNTGGAIGAGYYYWTGAAWTQLASLPAGGTPWSTSGNTDVTDISTQYLGTANNIPLNFRVNAQKSGRIDLTSKNTFWGYRAGDATTNVADQRNTAIGDSALFTLTTGTRNTVVGANAGKLLPTAGADVTALGFDALKNNTANQNTAIGSYALVANTTATGNTAVGYQTLNALTTTAAGNNNTAMGYQAGLGVAANNFSNNSLFGYQAGNLNTTGANVTAIGYQALKANTAANNTAVGSGALLRNTTATGNIAVGFQALNNAIATGDNDNNIAIGANALAALGTGGGGLGAGSSNVAIGTSAMTTATRMQQNVAIGIGAMQLANENTGASNVAVGFNAMSNAGNVGSNNTALGASAMFQNNTSASNNTAVGSQALNSKQQGNNNVAIGLNAGNGPCCAGGDPASDNTFIGTGAGSGLFGGDRNITLGFQAGDNISTGTNNIIIGYNIDALAAGTTNFLSIGNLIYGTTSTQGSATTVSTGKVGIMNNAPVATFDITQPVATTASPNGLKLTGGAHTTLTASTEASDVIFNLARVVQFSAGALTTQRAFLIQAPTYGFSGGSTLTNAATFAISGAPAAGANATISNSHALWVQGGNTQLDGSTTMNGAQMVKRTTSAAGAYTVLVTDYIIAKTGITGGGDAVTLPLISAAKTGQVFIISDESGTAAANNITITASGADLIEGAGTKVLNTNYGAVRLYSTGTAWKTL